MTRPSEEKRGLTPRKDAEIAFAKKLFCTLGIKADLCSSETPDVIASIDTKTVGIELTQIKHHDCETGLRAFFDEIEQYSFQENGADRDIWRISAYFEQDTTGRDFDGLASEDVYRQIENVARQIRDNALRDATGLEISFQADTCRVQFPGQSMKLPIRRPHQKLVELHISGAPSKALPRISVHSHGRAWTTADVEKNRQWLIRHYAVKYSKKYSSTDSLWLVVHYPDIGGGGLRLGMIENWTPNLCKGRFDRFFLFDIDDLFEYDFNNNRFYRN